MYAPLSLQAKREGGVSCGDLKVITLWLQNCLCRLGRYQPSPPYEAPARITSVQSYRCCVLELFRPVVPTTL
jgi:hypothetical protein